MPRALRPQASFRSVARTHAGAVRSANEDAYALRDDLGLWAIADGVGGHDSGEVASNLLAEEMRAICAAPGIGGLREQVENAIRRAHITMTKNTVDGARKTMGSTISALLGGKNCIECIWAGDSRIYRHRDDCLTRLTHDHSIVQRMIDEGSLDEEGARRHPQRNMITRAVGIQQELQLDVRSVEHSSGDKYLLCTDGLYDMLTDAELCNVISCGSIDETADLLLATALARGASDNVTLVLVEAVADSETYCNGK